MDFAGGKNWLRSLSRNCAQRLGRILRPKSDGQMAHFYTLVTRDTRELDFAQHRQLFLTEQGYSYRIEDEGNVAPASLALTC